jgi:type I restriction enzyme, S subunit
MFDTQPLNNAVGKQLGGGTPSRQVPKYWNGSIPWASVKDFAVGGDVIACTQERITEAGLFASASNLIPAGTPLVCTRMAVGRSALAMMPVAINQDVKALVPAAGTSAVYLLRLLQLIQPRAEAAAVGSTVKGIRIRDYLSIAVPMAPSQEQGRIAKVLDTLDTTIRQTEVIIEKLKQVKQGLLQDLLTRGIDANGKLRRPQSQAPHLYKESPLGWIPREWEVKRLGDFMAADITYGIVQAGPHVDGGVPYIRTGDMAGDRLVRVSLLRTSRRIADGYRRSEVRAGEIVMAIRATVGKVLPVPQDLDGANLTQGTARLAPNERTDAAFLLWAIRHQRAQESIQLEVKGTTFAEITLAALREVPLAAPIATDEQRLIGKQAAACEERIQLERQQRGKLVTLKSGLMGDLLCGRVRVTPLLDAAAPA